ncbi:MAG: transposase, partial [Anaerolineales bacterium]|nr:transposase [Anaerolineales bacterium]
LDAGYGACHLRRPEIGRLVENALLHFDGERYALLAWVIMPNHVHVLIESRPGHPLRQLAHSWKSYTAHQAGNLLRLSGPFWYHDYFDRFIRDKRHFSNTVRYIHYNPVTAGLVNEAADWPLSSARWFDQSPTVFVKTQAGRLRSQGEL